MNTDCDLRSSLKLCLSHLVEVPVVRFHPCEFYNNFCALPQNARKYLCYNNRFCTIYVEGCTLYVHHRWLSLRGRYCKYLTTCLEVTQGTQRLRSSFQISQPSFLYVSRVPVITRNSGFGDILYFLRA